MERKTFVVHSLSNKTKEIQFVTIIFDEGCMIPTKKSTLYGKSAVSTTLFHLTFNFTVFTFPGMVVNLAVPFSFISTWV